MGWRWHDDDGDSGRGLAGVPDLAGGRAEGEGAQCATRRVVQSRCHTEEVEPGRFVRKCEKTEQLLRDCVGRRALEEQLSKRIILQAPRLRSFYNSAVPFVFFSHLKVFYGFGSNDNSDLQRPSELVESKTENTEEDVTEEMKSGSFSLGFPRNEPFAFPGLRSDMEALEKGLFGSLGSVLDEAEQMTNNFIKSFGFPPTHGRESSPFPRQPAERHIGEGTAKKTKEGDYSEFGSQISDV